MAIAHVAGPFVDLLQRCVRCSAVLTDYRNALVRVGDPPVRGWGEGKTVIVDGPMSWVVTGEDDTPPCARRAPAEGKG